MLWQDLRYGARLLRLNPAFTFVATLSLALGIGANTAIFQLLDAVRLRSLPVKSPQELVKIELADTSHMSGNFSARFSDLSNPQWELLRNRRDVFSGMMAWSDHRFNLALGGEARYAEGLLVSGEFFSVLGVSATMGRVFTTDDDRRGCGSPGAVISYPFWLREFGGDAAALGKKVSLDGHPFDVLGVTPPGFFGVEVGRSFDVAIPICSEAVIAADSGLDKRHHWWLASIARLKSGKTVAQATAYLNSISPALFQETVPEIYQAEGRKFYLLDKLHAVPARSGVSSLRDEYATPLWLLLGIAGLVLLIACANLANLMLARASAREREIAIRLAMGASRGRLIRQLLSESLTLAFLGAAFGAFLAQALSRSLVSFLTTTSDPLSVDLNADWRILAFTAGLAVLTCILFGLTPALRGTRIAPAAVMKAAGRSITTTRERFGLRRILVVSQVALSLVLLVGALLFVRSLRNLLTLDAGFRQDGLLIGALDLRRPNYAPERRPEIFRQLLAGLRSTPGVDAAAESTIVPISGSGWNDYIRLDGSKDFSQHLISDFSRISSGYFKTMSQPLLAGRDLDERDTLQSPKVAIVNETFARKFLKGANPIGKRFYVQPEAGKPEPVYEIVGWVKDSKYQSLKEKPQPIAFVATSQEAKLGPGARFVLRSGAPLGTLLPAVQQTIRGVHPDISYRFRVFDTMVQESLLQERLMATLSGFFGLLAGVLATVGLYGVISYMVTRRQNEIGIRMALGAGRGDILQMILREAGLLLGIGIFVGTGLAVGVTRTARAMLYGLQPNDPVTIAMAIATLAAVALAASYLPARRAARLDPMVALRDE